MAYLVDALYRCQDCGLISSTINPDPAIYGLYYQIQYDRYETNETSKRLNDLRFGLLAKHVNLNKNISILDFGCGTGTFLRHPEFVLRKSLDVYGYDINPHSNYCDPSVLLKKFDVVTFWDCL